MSTITLPNIRVSSDLTVKVRLKDSGVAIDWSTLTKIKASIYSDAQRALAGRCDVSIDAEDSTLLVCNYAANKPQYVGVNRIVVSAKYMGETKTYDKPAFTFVRWTADQEGEQITIDDPDVDVEISVEDISSSILQEAVDAAFEAADRANDAAAAAEHMVDIHTGPEGKSAYEVAVEDGYVGTEEEWLASLVGPQGVQGIQGETGEAAGFGTVSVSLQEDGGQPSVVVAASGPDTAKQFDFTFKNLKGDKGDKGDQGNSGYQGAAGELEVVNNLTDGGSTAALSAEMGKTLKGEVSQLEAKVVDKREYGTINGKYINSGNSWSSTTTAISKYIAVKAGDTIHIEKNANINAYAACISSVDTSTPPVFKSGFTGVRADISNETIQVTEDCYFWWLVQYNSSQVYDPSVLTLNGVSILNNTYSVNKIDAINERVTELFTELSGEIEDAAEEVETVDAKMYQDIQIDGTWLGSLEKKYIDSHGNLDTNNSYRVRIIQNDGYVRIAGHGSSASACYVLAFYNAITPSSSTFISGVLANSGYADTTFDVDIPEGTIVIVVGYTTYSASTPSTITLYKKQLKTDNLDGRLTVLENGSASKGAVDKMLGIYTPHDWIPADFDNVVWNKYWNLVDGEAGLVSVSGYIARQSLYSARGGQKMRVTIPNSIVDPDSTGSMSAAAFAGYDNDGLPAYGGGTAARVDFISADEIIRNDDETTTWVFVLGASVSQVGLFFRGDVPFVFYFEQNEDVEYSETLDQHIHEVVGDDGEDEYDESAKYYLKGNSNVKIEPSKKLGIISAGQSNIDGRNSYSDLPVGFVNPNAKVRFCNNTNGTFSDFQITDGGHNNDWSFDAIVYDLLTKSAYGNLSEIYVMKKSMGGTSIDKYGATEYHWTADYEYLDTPSHSLLRTFESIIRKAEELQGENFQIRAFLWHQGEGDADTKAVAERYYDNLRNMLAYVRGIVGNPRLDFFCGNISENNHANPYIGIINDAYAQLASEDPYFHCVDMRNAVLEDPWHFNYQWSIYFGQKVYDLMIDAGIITGTKINPSEPS